MWNIKTKLIKVVSVIVLLSPFPVFSSGQFGFESAEHIAAGESITLFFGNDTAGVNNPVLHLENGLALSYAQVIALSGDFYGIPGQTISEGKTQAEREQRFIAAYNTLAKDAASVDEVPKIYAIMQYERNAVIEGMNNGEKPEAVFARIADDDNRQWNCVTGGGCGSMWWLSQGRYLNLAKRDFDHFGENAWLAYQAGHAVAMRTAIAAHASQNLAQLEIAYSQEAFANHFLSDRFAAGHLRTPRPELPASVTPSVIGSVLATYMHSEENQYGLHVHNQRGQHWVAAGDRYFYDAQNNVNRQMLIAALQESVNALFYSYQHGVAPEKENVAAMIPEADETKSQAQQDISPLFYWNNEEQALYRRTDVANVNDNHWTTNWWGWSTLMLLSSQHGLPIESQRVLVAEGYGQEAMQHGLISDKTIMNYVKSMKKN